MTSIHNPELLKVKMFRFCYFCIMPKFITHHHVVEGYLSSRFTNPFGIGGQQPVIVLDGICGIGKTTDIKEEILKIQDANKNNRFIYVSLYRKELLRFVGSEVDQVDDEHLMLPQSITNKALANSEDNTVFEKFKHPTRSSKHRTLLSSLKALILGNEDIVITHKLLSMIDIETLDLLKLRSYHLIIDEDPVLIEPADRVYNAKLGNGSTVYSLGADEVSYLFKQKNLTSDKDGLVSWQGDLLRYTDLKTDAENRKLRMYRLKGKSNPRQEVLMWVQNPDLFASFKSIHLLTYLFDGSITQGYFDAFKIPYLKLNKTFEYSLSRVEKTDSQIFADRIDPIHDLIEIVHESDWVPELPLPGGEGVHQSFSSAWYAAYKGQKGLDKNLITRKLENYFKRPLSWRGAPAKASEKMWSTYKAHKYMCRGKGYTKGFQPFNLRATNDLRHKCNLAYLVNPFPVPQIAQYLKDRNAGFSVDQWSTSVLIQWLFRSALRDGEKVKLYLPSERMHRLLKNWIVNYKAQYQFPRNVINKYPSTDDMVPNDQRITPSEFLKKHQPGLRHFRDIKKLLNVYTKPFTQDQ